MSDSLTLTERRLIDAAVADGKVTRLPDRTKDPDEWLRQWLATPLEPSPHAPKVEGKNKFYNVFGKRRPRGPGKVARLRREKVRALAAQGLYRDQIADRLGCSIAVVSRDIVAAGIECRNRTTRPKKPHDEVVRKRREAVRDLAAEGLTGPQIGKRLGIACHVVHHDARRMGIKLKPAREASNG